VKFLRLAWFWEKLPKLNAIRKSRGRSSRRYVPSLEWLEDRINLSVPIVGMVTPNNGATTGGTTVSIQGQYFTGASQVKFGALSASFSVNSDNSITATAPAEAAGTIDVFVMNSSGSSAANSGDHFTYYAPPAPTVSGVSPNTGPVAGGTVVTIGGSNFTGATSVLFGTVAASSFTVNSASQITATAPAESPATVDVFVINSSGSSSANSGDHFTYYAPPAPTVSGASPNTGPTTGGTVVTVGGNNFTGATAVMFGNVAASSFTVNSATQITATAPPEAAGTVDIRVTTPGGTSPASSSDQFTFAAPITSQRRGLAGPGGRGPNRQGRGKFPGERSQHQRLFGHDLVWRWPIRYRVHCGRAEWKF
jgi:hypothetical protein